MQHCEYIVASPAVMAGPRHGLRLSPPFYPSATLYLMIAPLMLDLRRHFQGMGQYPPGEFQHDAKACQTRPRILDAFVPLPLSLAGKSCRVQYGKIGVSFH
jgi:hypothetical protein